MKRGTFRRVDTRKHRFWKAIFAQYGVKRACGLKSRPAFCREAAKPHVVLEQSTGLFVASPPHTLTTTKGSAFSQSEMPANAGKPTAAQRLPFSQSEMPANAGKPTAAQRLPVSQSEMPANAGKPTAAQRLPVSQSEMPANAGKPTSPQGDSRGFSLPCIKNCLSRSAAQFWPGGFACLVREKSSVILADYRIF